MQKIITLIISISLFTSCGGPPIVPSPSEVESAPQEPVGSNIVPPNKYKAVTTEDELVELLRQYWSPKSVIRFCELNSTVPLGTQNLTRMHNFVSGELYPKTDVIEILYYANFKDGKLHSVSLTAILSGSNSYYLPEYRLGLE